MTGAAREDCRVEFSIGDIEDGTRVPSQTFESGFGANMIHWWPDGQATANRAPAQIAH
jgi:hypothetical protein